MSRTRPAQWVHRHAEVPARSAGEGRRPLYFGRILRGSLALAPQDDDAMCHIFIDLASLFVLPNAPNLAHRGTSTGDDRLVERVRFLRAGFVTSPPGGPGIVPSGTTTGARGAPLKRDWRRG